MLSSVLLSKDQMVVVMANKLPDWAIREPESLMRKLLWTRKNTSRFEENVWWPGILFLVQQFSVDLRLAGIALRTENAGEPTWRLEHRQLTFGRSGGREAQSLTGLAPFENFDPAASERCSPTDLPARNVTAPASLQLLLSFYFSLSPCQNSNQQRSTHLGG